MKSIKGFKRYGADTKFKGNPLTFTCDLDLESRVLGRLLCTPSYYREHMSEVS